MIWIGGIIIVIAFWLIIKRFETKLVLFSAGVAMAVISEKIPEVLDAFTKTMVNSSLVPVICTVMGFAFVMKYTKCDMHMVHLLAGAMKKLRPILIPGTVMLTFAINIALPSAAGCAAAVGAIMIPTLIAAGIHPAVAGAAVLAGTFGSILSPGSAHAPFIAKLANVDVMTVIANQTMASVAAGLIGAVCLYMVALLKKEHFGYVANIENTQSGNTVKVNFIKAIVPLIPLAILVLGSKQLHVIREFSVPEAMLIGTVIGLAVSMSNPQEVCKEFFKGMGDAYGGVIGLIVAAAVFTKGMELVGITGALIDVMKNSQQIAKVASAAGPMIIAVLCGSGDAATLAFNGAITPHAGDFGFGITQMGSTAFISGALGRTMSPVAGSAIVCAQLAGVDPIELAKRNAPGMIIATIATVLILL